MPNAMRRSAADLAREAELARQRHVYRGLTNQTGSEIVQPGLLDRVGLIHPAMMLDWIRRRIDAAQNPPVR